MKKINSFTNYNKLENEIEEQINFIKQRLDIGGTK